MADFMVPRRVEAPDDNKNMGGENRPGVLIVDDDAVVRRFCCVALERSGYRTFAASDAEECLQFLKSNGDPVRLVLLDIHMPGRTGLDILHEIRRLRPSAVVVAMSGLGDPRLGPAVESGSIHSFLMKPFTVSDLCSTVGKCLSCTPSART